jgi:hypothetical protein
VYVIIHLLAFEDGTECSETSAYKIQTPVNYSEENIQHTEHGESLKSRIRDFLHRVCIGDLFIHPFVYIISITDVNGVRLCKEICAV